MDHLEPKIVVCAVCEQEFDANTRNRGKGVHRYCGKVCRQKADNARHYARRNPPKTEADLMKACVVCGISFVADVHHPNAKTCSVKCNEARMNAKRRRVTLQTEVSKECEECGKTFHVHRLAPKTGLRTPKFCSRQCATRVSQRRYAERNVSRYASRLGSDWRRCRQVALARDGGKCVACGETKGLHVHHAFNRTVEEAANHAVEGLLSLCGKCHNKVHDIRLGRQDGKIVVSGLIFDLLGIAKVSIVKQNGEMMPQNREYPAKTRPAAAMDRSVFPSKSRGAGVDEGQPSGPSPRKGGDMGNKPKKGVLTTGGGHG